MKIGRVIRKTFSIVFSLAVLVVVLVWMSGGFRRKVQPHKVEAEHRRVDGLTTDTVHSVVELETAEAVGTLKAQRRTVVSAKIMATIDEITVSAGDKVRKGQVLVRLDDRDVRARLEQAKKAVEGAQAAAQQAAADLKRYRALLDQKVIPRQTYDQQEARFKIAQAELKRAREAVHEAEVMLSYTVIRSPTDGIVVDKHADVGDTAAPGQPLVTIYDPGALRLEAPVRETLASKIKVGDRLKVKIDALGVTLEGRIDEIVPQAQAQSRSVLVKVALPKTPGMVEGMFGRLLVPTRKRKRYCVPLSAVLRVGQLRFVDVVTTGGILERRPVKLGEHSEYGRIEVLSGLNEGDTVVLYGPPPPPFLPVRREGREG